MYVLNMSEYDSVLREVLRVVRQRGSGVVGAAIVDGDKRVVVPSAERDGKFLHAERNAFESFCEQYGEPSADAAVVTTLSPCKIDDEHRVGDSCTDLLCSNNISRVHTGYIDPWQLSISEYSSLGVDVTETNDSALYGVCEALFEYFPRTIEDGEEIEIESFVRDAIPSAVVE